MMRHGCLALLLIMPSLGGAEVMTAAETSTQGATAVEQQQTAPEATVPDAASTPGAVSPTKVEPVLPATDNVVMQGSEKANPPSAVAAEPVSAPPESKPRPTLVEKLKAQEAASPRTAAPAWSNMIFGLFTVLGLILGMAWLTKKVRARVPGFAGQLNVVESTALGPRERLCIVEVDGKRLLLGVTQQSITVLQTSDCETRKDEADSMFSEKIKKMLQNGTANGR